MLLIFTYLPLLQFFVPNWTTQPALTSNYYIDIPKISAQAPIIAGVNPWNESEYEKALQKGVAQAKGTSLPGQPGTIYLFAHSSLPPWEITRTNTAFLRLGELVPGDKIIIERQGVKYDYTVTGEKVVWPNNVSYLTQDLQINQLILQTCTPIGTSLQRLLVFAKPINTYLVDQ